MPVCMRCGTVQASVEIRKTASGGLCKDKTKCWERREKQRGEAQPKDAA